MNRFKRLAAAALLAASAIAPARANLVTNGDFESSGGWDNRLWFITSVNVLPHSGQNTALLACSADWLGCTLGQSLATVAGQRYDLRFWLYASGVSDENGVPIPNEGALDIWFGDEQAAYYQNIPTTNPNQEISQPGPMTLVTIRGLLATSSETYLEFTGYNVGYGYYIDDVSVEAAASAVPEPGSIALMGAALAGLATSRRRKQRARDAQ